jgi:serine/threonine protein kinase
VALTPGNRFGSYTIVAPIGAGGMGEVYRAHDARLGRDVAIKVLTRALSADPERLRRFEHEARAIAALNHPNILTVHEIGSDSPEAFAPPVRFVVSELLEGDTLRDLLTDGPLPLKKAIDYAAQIVNGLAAAHAKGIVHRDLKPENLFVTRDGRVKILDFGLAKLNEVDTVSSGAGASMLATRNFETAAGTVLGTVGYMSPEQLRGQNVDYRSDIFSFGAVLYEMLSGRRAFHAPTAADTITAMLTSDPPDLAATSASIPPALDQIVRHCLEKTPELRYQAARDIAFALETLSIPTSAISQSIPAVPKRSRLPRLAAVLALAVAAGVLAAVGVQRSVARSSPGWGSFRQLTYRHGTLDNARFAPGGNAVIYTAAWERGAPEVFSVGVNESGGRPLDIKNAVLLAVSRTGELAILLNPKPVTSFILPGTLARELSTGAAPRPEIENVVGADYLPDGSLAIVRYDPGPRQCQLEYPIGTVLLRAAYLSDLRVSRDGRLFAAIEHEAPGDDRGAVVVVGRDGQKKVTGQVRDSHRGLAWSAAGDEVWTTAPLLNGSIQSLDLAGHVREVLALPGKLFLRDIAPNGAMLVEQSSGRRGLVVASDGGQSERDLSWLDYSYLRGITDDGKVVFFDEEGLARGYTAFVRSTDGSSALEVGSGYAVALSADKAWMLTDTFTDNGIELWLRPVGPGQARRLIPVGLRHLPLAAFFKDGKRIVFNASEGSAAPRIYVMSLDGTPPKPISPPGTRGAPISPDQKWISALSPAGPVLVPVDGGESVPVRGIDPGEALRGWTADGQVYVANTSSVGVLRIDIVNPWTGKRTPWRQLRNSPLDGVRTTNPFITPDGSTYAYPYDLRLANLFLVQPGR